MITIERRSGVEDEFFHVLGSSSFHFRLLDQAFQNFGQLSRCPPRRGLGS